MITVQSALVANAAHLEPSGLVSVLGAWVDTVTGPQLPIRQQLWFVARLEADRPDTANAHTFAIIVEHSDGSEQVARVEGAVPPVPPAALEQLDLDIPVGIPIVVQIAVEFRRVGLYYFRLLVDGDSVWSSPLRVRTVLPQL